MLNLKSKLPNVGTTIFTQMSALARQNNAINLSQGFPDFEPDERVKEAANKALKENYHQYALMAGSLKLRENIVKKYAQISSINIHPEKEITITAGGTQAIFTAIQAVVKTDDEVLLFSPSYDSYAPSVELAGGKCIYYNMLPPDFKINWQQVRQLISEKTKLIIFNSPHNPSASLLTSDDIVQLKNILKNNSALLLSDEVYEHVIFDGQKHQSFLNDDFLRSRSFVISSFGKTYHTTGWKVGYCIAPEMLTTEFRKVHQFNVFSVNSIAQEAFANILEYPELYENLPAFYEEKRNYFRSLLKDTPFELLDCKGTYFQLADYSKISNKSDIEFCKWLTKELGIATIPVSVFYNNADISIKLLRFCFAKRVETLEMAAERLRKI